MDLDGLLWYTRKRVTDFYNWNIIGSRKGVKDGEGEKIWFLDEIGAAPLIALPDCRSIIKKGALIPAGMHA